MIIALAVLMLTWLSTQASRANLQKADIEKGIAEACSQCHRLPPPEIIARSQWRGKINEMFHLANLELLGKYGRPIWELDPPSVAAYFMERAPEELPEPEWGPSPVSPKVKFERSSIPGGQTLVERPGGANVQLWDIFDDVDGPELVVCDMLSGWVTWVDPDHPEKGLNPIAQLKNPCHSEMVDLDQDGQLDLLISELGDPLPSDAKFGSVAVLRRIGPRQFETIRLTPDIGRVADARPADFDGDGDLDIVVAEFGWRKLGSILFLENVSDASGLRFESSLIDPRHGTIHVPVLDLNSDGLPDFLALISQEHEMITAYINQGKVEFKVEEVYTAPHPHWGASGMEPVDFDGDGDLDLLVTNGDTLDDLKIKTYHGISWLENTGGYPYKLHHIDSYYGVHRAEPGDLDGDGDLDFVASTFLPDLPDNRRESLMLPGLVWYERVGKNQFQKHTLLDERCDFATLDVGDFNGDGLLDVMTANLMGTPRADGSEPALVEILQQKK
jgi:hypothetical protein